MSNNVDVLAVMELAEKVMRAKGGSGGGLLSDISKARAAVAELIEAMDNVLAGEGNYFVVGTDGVRIREIRVTQEKLSIAKNAIYRVRGVE